MVEVFLLILVTPLPFLRVRFSKNEEVQTSVQGVRRSSYVTSTSRSGNKTSIMSLFIKRNKKSWLLTAVISLYFPCCQSHIHRRSTSSWNLEAPLHVKWAAVQLPPLDLKLKPLAWTFFLIYKNAFVCGTIWDKAGSHSSSEQGLQWKAKIGANPWVCSSHGFVLVSTKHQQGLTPRCSQKVTSHHRDQISIHLHPGSSENPPCVLTWDE